MPDEQRQKALERRKRLVELIQNSGYVDEINKLRSEAITKYGELVDQVAEFRLNIIQDINEIYARLDDLEAFQTQAINQVQSLNQSLNQLNIRVTALEAFQTQAITQIQSANSAIADLQTRVTALENP